MPVTKLCYCEVICSIKGNIFKNIFCIVLFTAEIQRAFIHKFHFILKLLIGNGIGNASLLPVQSLQHLVNVPSSSADKLSQPTSLVVKAHGLQLLCNRGNRVIGSWLAIL